MNLVKGRGTAEWQVPQTQVRIPPKAVICTPSLDGNVTLEYMVSLIETITTCQSAGITIDVASVRGDCFIAKARNHLINKFLALNGENLFFIDADQGWDVAAFMRMINDPHELIAGAVPKKMDDLTFNNVDLVTDDKKNCVIESGLMEVRSIGSGFMKITRDAIHKLIEKFPETYIPGDGSPGRHYKLFETAIIDDHFNGEDIAFCKKWTSIGGRIFIDPNINFKHTGRKTWEGNFLSYLQKNCNVQMSKVA